VAMCTKRSIAGGYVHQSSLAGGYVHQEESSWWICAPGGTRMRLAGGHVHQVAPGEEPFWFFLWHLYGYDVTRCYLCNNTDISINI
jgi:hypothetical protein